MKTRSSLFRASGRDAKSGQMVVIFALCLIAIIAMAGLLIDGGNAWAQRRQAQAAADTAALAGAVARSNQANAAATAAAARADRGRQRVRARQRRLQRRRAAERWRHRELAADERPALRRHRLRRGLYHPVHAHGLRRRGRPALLDGHRPSGRLRPHPGRDVQLLLAERLGRPAYVLLIDNGNDLRVDGDIFSNHGTWYGGAEAVNRCGGANPCSAATCHDGPSPNGGQSDNILMCGQSIYVDHSGGLTTTILSAKTIAAAGGWQARSKDDIIHADQPTANCVAHPKNLNYPTAFLQETNVCIGSPADRRSAQRPGQSLRDHAAAGLREPEHVSRWTQAVRAGRIGDLRGRARVDAQAPNRHLGLSQQDDHWWGSQSENDHTLPGHLLRRLLGRLATGMRNPTSSCCRAPTSCTAADSR